MKNLNIVYTLTGFFLFSLVSISHSEQVSSSKKYKLTQEKLTPALNLPPVAADVNGTPIPIAKYWAHLVRQSGTTVLTQLVDEILIQQEIEKKLNSKLKKKMNREVKQRYAKFKKQFKNKGALNERLEASGITEKQIKSRIRLEVQKELLVEDKMKVSQEEMDIYFNANKEKLSLPERIRLKHILVATELEANDVELALRSGAEFDLLAKEKSMDSGTSEKGGDLGYFSPGMMIPEIQKTVSGLKEKEIGIVQTILGFHVVKVAEKKSAKEAKWNKKTKKNVKRILERAKFNQQFPEYIQNLRAKSDIKIYLNQ